MAAVNPKHTYGYLNSLSNFENGVCLLYQSVAAKFDAPLVSGLLQGLAQDSLKHAKLLKAITEGSSYTEEKVKELSSELANAWRAADSGFRERMAIGTLSGSDQREFIEKLTELESVLIAEYSSFLTEDILLLFAKETSGQYKVAPDHIRGIFLAMINDKRQHKKLLATIVELVYQNKNKSVGVTPVVKYQNPNSW